MNYSRPTDKPCSRRQFIEISAGIGTVAALSIGDSSFCWGQDESAAIPIIDCHQHLWDLDKQDIPWLENGNSPLRRNYVMSDYREAIAGTGIKHAVYMEVDVAKTDKVAEGELLTAICQAGDSPTIAAVIGCVPDEPGFRDYIAHWKDNRYIKGMRIVLGSTAAGSEPRCLSKKFVEGIQQLGTAGLSFDLCMPAEELGYGTKLMAACRDTKFIVDHVGNADPNWWGVNPNKPAIARWQKDMSALAEKKNTLCKISGIIARVPKEWSTELIAPAINFCLDTYGPERVVFGSDWPVCLKGAPLKDWVRALREIIADRPEKEQRQLLFDNAVREYGLKV